MGISRILYVFVIVILKNWQAYIHRISVLHLVQSLFRSRVPIELPVVHSLGSVQTSHGIIVIVVPVVVVHVVIVVVYLNSNWERERSP